jgi:outer membrane protein assembly factor BamC
VAAASARQRAGGRVPGPHDGAPGQQGRHRAHSRGGRAGNPGHGHGATPSAALPATASLTLNEGFDRAWRQVGLALDRSGFTVEDRDRSAGLYFVRYIDPRLAGKEEPNFLQRLFRGESEARPVRYRVQVKSSGNSTTVSVQNSQGEADNSNVARQIIGRLSEDLR